MNPKVYVDGHLADGIGALGLRALADCAARLADRPVDVLVHGNSRYHEGKCYTGVVVATDGFQCRACGRDEEQCSASPCEAVERDREATI